LPRRKIVNLEEKTKPQNSEEIRIIPPPAGSHDARDARQLIGDRLHVLAKKAEFFVGVQTASAPNVAIK
jgi:hypothetical protein